MQMGMMFPNVNAQQMWYPNNQIQIGFYPNNQAMPPGTLWTDSMKQRRVNWAVPPVQTMMQTNTNVCKPAAGVIDFKESVCKYWRIGYCQTPGGTPCEHGTHDPSFFESEPLPFKTEHCKSYDKGKGTCKYGMGCAYLHGENDPNPRLTKFQIKIAKVYIKPPVINDEAEWRFYY